MNRQIILVIVSTHKQMERFKSYVNADKTNIRIDSFVFQLVNMRKTEIKQAIDEFVEWAVLHQRQNHHVTLVGHASVTRPLLNEK